MHLKLFALIMSLHIYSNDQHCCAHEKLVQLETNLLGKHKQAKLSQNSPSLLPKKLPYAVYINRRHKNTCCFIFPSASYFSSAKLCHSQVAEADFVVTGDHMIKLCLPRLRHLQSQLTARDLTETKYTYSCHHELSTCNEFL